MTQANGKQPIQPAADETIYVGIDLHKKSWHVTIRTFDIELHSVSIPATWQALQQRLKPYHGHCIQAVYEAGYFGFWLHDELQNCGVHCIVTPPSLIPEEAGNRVKTDRRDSRKLALLLAKGLLKQVYVPTPQERSHRQVVRRRRQLIHDRVRVQCQIKGLLRCYNIEVPDPKYKWTNDYVAKLCALKFTDKWMQQSFASLLEQYEFVSQQITRQTALLRELAQTAEYKEKVAILCSVPGIGMVAAMELLLELQDVARFRRAEQLAAYVGLTPSQHSSGEKVRLGHITRIGKTSLRATLVEVSWMLIGKDGVMREKYEGIKARAGAKRAIVAIARHLLLRCRRMLLDKQSYAVGVVG
jgi:transposase